MVYFFPIGNNKKLLLIDVDCGTDDAQALMMAIASPKVKILGITCVAGNTNLDNVCKNVLRVLKLCNRLDVSNYTVIIIYVCMIYIVI